MRMLSVVHCLVLALILGGSSQAHRSLQARQWAPGCGDEVEGCEEWAQNYDCMRNPGWMRKHCSVACNAGVCRSSSSYFRSRRARLLSGHVTEYGTRRFATQTRNAERIPGGFFRRDVSLGEYILPNQRVRGNPWVTLSTMGIGTYLGGIDDETDEQVVAAILRSIATNWNVIDTASNYRNGRGEKAVGEALQSLVAIPSHGFSRSMFFLSTKAGYVSDEIRENLLAQGLISQQDLGSGSNCIHPACIKDSLKQSLHNMHIDKIDLLYLHNAAEAFIPRYGKAVFLKRLKIAFQALEDARKKGSIQVYGMATWSCFRVPPDHELYISLESIVKLAESVGGFNHGFRYIQLPVNVVMQEAWKEEWQTVNDKEMPVVEAAAVLGVGVFASSPLQAGRLFNHSRIADAVNNLMELQDLRGLGPKMLQLARSTPYVTAALVGHKSDSHVKENMALSAVEPLNEQEFFSAMEELNVKLTS